MCLFRVAISLLRVGRSVATAGERALARGSRGALRGRTESSRRFGMLGALESRVMLDGAEGDQGPLDLEPPVGAAAIFTVSNTINSGAGSLRQAIINANAAATNA